MLRGQLAVLREVSSAHQGSPGPGEGLLSGGNEGLLGDISFHFLLRHVVHLVDLRSLSGNLRTTSEETLEEVLG